MREVCGMEVLRAVDVEGAAPASEPERRRVYLSGPMTGLPGFNAAAFDAAAQALERPGVEVFNPAALFRGDKSRPRTEYMAEDLKNLTGWASEVVVLPGWATSRGACLEVLAALEMGLPVSGLSLGGPVPLSLEPFYVARRLAEAWESPVAWPHDAVDPAAEADARMQAAGRLRERLLGARYDVPLPAICSWTPETLLAVADWLDEASGDAYQCPAPPPVLARYDTASAVETETARRWYAGVAENLRFRVEIAEKLNAARKAMRAREADHDDPATDALLADRARHAREPEADGDVTLHATGSVQVDRVGASVADALSTDANAPATVLDIARDLVYGDRGADYGHPAEDYAATGAMWGAVLARWAVDAAEHRREHGIDAAPLPVPPHLAVLCMCAVKLSRECRVPKRDNRIDLAGYAECADRVIGLQGWDR